MEPCSGRVFDSRRLHRPGRCVNGIVLVMLPAQWNSEVRVDGMAAVHPDLVDQSLEQGFQRAW